MAGSDDITFTHEGRQLEDGRFLAFSWNTNTSGTQSWNGFEIFVTEPGSGVLDWSWSSQAGYDAGVFPAGYGDVYHGNWADLLVHDDGTERAYASMCNTSWIVAIDVESGEPIWRFGPDGDFTLLDDEGNVAPITEYPDCQHGIEVGDDELLVYDNGVTASQSRVSLYSIDESAMTAQRTWSWTEEGWNNPWLGDADYLPDDRVSITQANPTCFAGLGGILNHVTEIDRATDEVVWRGTLAVEDLYTFRSERADTCDVMPHLRWCDDAQLAYAEVVSAFE